MISLDYITFASYNRKVISTIYNNNAIRLHSLANESGWVDYDVYRIDKLIKLYFHRNKFGEYDKVFISFSPHIITNKGRHNANFFNYDSALAIIRLTFFKLGLLQDDFSKFYISSVEIGINFKVHRDPYLILESALMFDRRFFKAHTVYKHYKYVENEKNKYKKVKFYIKSEQIDNRTGLRYHELRYCENNVMRFEIKIERADKFTFFDFSNMNNLFSGSAEQIFKSFLTKEYKKMFFFSLKEVNQKKIKSNIQKKHFSKWQVPNFWEQLTARKRNAEKKFYNELEKLFDLKKEIGDLLFGR